jgi:competence protein ComEC
LKPARILFRIAPIDPLSNPISNEHIVCYNNKNILLLDESIGFTTADNKPVIDLLVISKNPKLYIAKLAAGFTIKQIVFDGSVPGWKLNYWKKDCDSLHIPYYDVNDKGAFVMNLN